ncbi:NADP-dependent oxidoreductase [Halosimplex aquaticum]
MQRRSRGTLRPRGRSRLHARRQPAVPPGEAPRGETGPRHLRPGRDRRARAGPGEALVRTRYLSVDPYMRGRMSAGESYAEPWEVGDPLRAAAVGEVVESNGAGFDEGDVVVGNLEWADYTAAPGTELTAVDPDLAPVSTALGVLGMPGRTAYFGVREVAEPKAGDTFVVTGAAGAVGSVAGQIAALSGARVVGFAGSDEKVAFLEDQLGFDAGINYKETDDYRAALDEAAPDGVDAYFDNVGGPITDAVFDRLNVDARVAICGQIAHYNATERPTGPRKLSTVLTKRARVEGFLVGDFAPRFEQATKQLGEWVASGEIEYRETVTDGLETAPDAFLGLFEGENIGKQLVKVSDANE